MAETRLGDEIDDYCVKCRRITNHSVVSMVNREPAKMRCRTCYNEHDYRREKHLRRRTRRRKRCSKRCSRRSIRRPWKQRRGPEVRQDAVEEELTEMADKEVV